MTTYEQARMWFGADGGLTAIRERNGQGVTIDRAGGRIVAVHNGRRALRYAYGGSGLLASITAVAPGVEPRVVRHEHESGRLTAVTSPGGLVTRYSYGSIALTLGFRGRVLRVVTEDDSPPNTTNAQQRQPPR
jgi:YD repeat-containing protein